MPGQDVSVTLNGGEHSLRFRLSAWRAIERQGYPKLSDFFEALQNVSMQACAVGLWAMLQEESPPPTLEAVSSWVDGENFGDVLAQMGEAIRGAFPPLSPPAAAPPTP